MRALLSRVVVGLPLLLPTACSSPAAAAPDDDWMLQHARLLSGEFEADSFVLPEGQQLAYDGELIIRCVGDIVIDGRIVGVSRSVGEEPRHAPQLVLRSATRIIVRGEILGAHGADGWPHPLIERALADAGLSHDGSEASLMQALTDYYKQHGPLAIEMESLRGGNGGDVLLEAPMLYLHGLMRAGDGGAAAPGGDGGHGGHLFLRETGERVAVDLRGLDSSGQGFGGKAGRAGFGTHALNQGKGGRGGNGGSAGRPGPQALVR